MNLAAAERDIRLFLQREFYLEGNSDHKTQKMQDAAAKYAFDNFPALTKCVIKVDYFGELSIELAQQ